MKLIIVAILSLIIFFIVYIIIPWGIRNLLRKKFLNKIKKSNHICLTFDDGPDPNSTPKILKLLNQSGMKATFFVIGPQVSSFPDMIRAEIIDKNYIGNHTNSHTSLDGISKEQFIEEIEATEKAVVDAAGGLIPEEIRLYYNFTVYN